MWSLKNFVFLMWDFNDLKSDRENLQKDSQAWL